MPKTLGPNIRLQPRDIKVLRGLYESRLATLKHATALWFDGHQEAAKKRLARLKRAKLIGERPRHKNEPALLYLKRAGYELLRSGDHLDGLPTPSVAAFEKRIQVSDLTIRHETAVMDVKAAFCSAVAAAENLEMREFITWPRLCSFEATPGPMQPLMTVKPDGFVRVEETDANGNRWEHAMFLEVDRSTHSLEKLAKKARCYLDYYRSGSFAATAGASHDQYRSHPFRVLWILKTPARRANLAHHLLENRPAILAQAWMITLDQFIQDPLGQGWRRPTQYLDSKSNDREDLRLF